MSDPESYFGVLEQLISAERGHRVRVVGADRLAHLRGEVLRLTVEPELPGRGRTLIAKRRDPAGEPAAFAATNLETEERALRVLSAAGAGIGPQIVAGGHAGGMLVLTDVGRPLEDALFGADPDLAEAALVSLGTTTARLHRVPIDPAAFSDLGTWSIATREDGWETVAQAVSELRFTPPSEDAQAEHRMLRNELRSPGGFTVLVHGDLGPNNAVLDADGSCRLVDFEGSGPQHLGIDAAMLRFPFAWYGRWAPMPPSVQAAMEAAYREELGWAPAAVDEAIAVGSMAMTLLRLERLPRVAAEDQQPEHAFRRRTQIVDTMTVALGAARHVGRFPALCEFLDHLLVSMRERWPEANETAATYPAFAGSRSKASRARSSSSTRSSPTTSPG
ncbi:MAG TPA: aminoglycoside phosphotransferase family protein [Acidimicrobiales bacterium]|nr:aminoglycoside phosphotransferase family protein [Acidimicrobiales bacterium]